MSYESIRKQIEECPCLNEDEKLGVLTNLDNLFEDEGIQAECHYNPESDNLAKLFFFGWTPQGHNYWAAVARRLGSNFFRDREVDLTKVTWR